MKIQETRVSFKEPILWDEKPTQEDLLKIDAICLGILRNKIREVEQNGGQCTTVFARPIEEVLEVKPSKREEGYIITPKYWFEYRKLDKEIQK